MDSLDLCYSPVSTLSRLFKAKKLSPIDLVQAQLDRIQTLQPKLNAFITVTADTALAAARQAESEIARGDYRGPLHGVTFAPKDVCYAQGVRNTAGVKIYDQFVPDFDSTIVARLKKAGAILIGKLNMAPFGLRGSGKNEFYGDPRNPWDTARVTGGSSSGSGAATAAGLVTCAIGGDTGGSVRIPASLSGIVGHKPTYGLVSRFGVTPLAWSIDVCGPMTRTVLDSAYVMDAIAGHDPRDPASANTKALKSSAGIKKGIKGLRIGVPREFWQAPIEPEVKAAVQKAIGLLQDLGAQVREVTWPNVFWAVTFGHLISIADGSGAMGRLARQPNPSPELRELLRHYPRIASGALMSAADYLLAQRMRQRYLQDARKVISDLDLIVGPTMPMTAFPLDAAKITINGDTRNPESFVPTYCRPYNTSGLPAVTIPCGFDSQGLPIGLQIAAGPFHDALALRAAYAYEQATDWRTRRPPL